MSFGIWHFISRAGCNAIYLCFYCNARANNRILLVNLSVWTFFVVVADFVRFIFTFASYAIQDSLHTVILSHCIHIHIHIQYVCRLLLANVCVSFFWFVVVVIAMRLFDISSWMTTQKLWNRKWIYLSIYGRRIKEMPEYRKAFLIIYTTIYCWDRNDRFFFQLENKFLKKIFSNLKQIHIFRTYHVPNRMSIMSKIKRV